MQQQQQRPDQCQQQPNQAPDNFIPNEQLMYGVVLSYESEGEGCSISNSIRAVTYSVYPFFTGQKCPRILTLMTRDILQPGNWIKFDNRALQTGIIDSGSWGYNKKWFDTMPVLNKVVMECDILVPPSRNHHQTIRTRIHKPKPFPTNPTIPFISDIKDSRKLLQQKHRNRRLVCATLEYRQGYWHICHLRPFEYLQQK